MKKIIIAAIMLLATAAQANTVSKTFTTHSQSGPGLSVKRNATIEYSISGTFVGTVAIEKTMDGVNYKQVTADLTAPASGSFANTTKDSVYRVRCSTHTSGSIVTSLSNKVEVLQDLRNSFGYTTMKVSDGIVEVTAGSSASGTLCLAGSFSTLPVAGYNKGCFAYQTSDDKAYVSTETVVRASSWKALW